MYYDSIIDQLEAIPFFNRGDFIRELMKSSFKEALFSHVLNETEEERENELLENLMNARKEGADEGADEKAEEIASVLRNILPAISMCSPHYCGETLSNDEIINDIRNGLMNTAALSCIEELERLEYGSVKK